jgi:hypothetical protein
VVVLGLLFARRSVTGRIAAGSFVAFGVSYVASTLAVGFPPGAAALYGAQHGAAPLDLAMVNDIRNFGFYLQVALSAAMALCLGLAAVAERTHTRWIGWGGIALGTGGIVAVPFAHNAVSMLFLLWWAGLGVIALRARSSQPGRIPQD